jgi:Spy/CpxP family protein refolding chaperone
VAAILAIASSAAVAQQQEDPIERQVERLKDQLKLTEEQVGKVREVLKKNNEDIRGVLTDEQKKTYDENLARGGRGNRGGGGGFGQGGGGFRGFGGQAMPSTDELKQQLNLTDEQVTKIDTLRDEIRQEMRDFFQGGPQRDEIQKKMEEIRDAAIKRTREVLTDEQKPKFDEIVKNFQQGGGDGPRPPGMGQRGPQRPSVDERLRRLMEALKIEKADEAAAIRDAAKKVIEAQYALEDYDREVRTKVDELAKKAEITEDEVKTKLEELRTARKDKDKAVKDAQKGLAEIITYKQELEFIKQGILR